MQRRRGHNPSPNQGNGTTPKLGKHLLLEEGRSSKTIRELLIGWEVMRRAAAGEEKDEAAKVVLGLLKANGLVDANMVNLDRVETTKLLIESIKHILESVNPIEPRGLIESRESDELVADIQKTDDYVLVVTDREGRLKKNPEIMATAMEALERFRCMGSDKRYAAHLLAAEEFVGMRIDDGKHKGYIALFCPESSEDWIMYFNHSEHGQGLFPSNRIRYVMEALRKERMNVDFRQTALKGENAGHVRGIRFEIREWEGMLTRLIRLSRSVKDLDLILKSERVTEIAIRAFNNGVTNMKSFLYALEDRVINPKEDWQKHKLNAHEKKVLAKYYAEGKNLKKEVNSHKRYIKTFLKFSGEVKKLNFEMLEELTKLQNLLLRYRHRKVILKREVNALFRDIANKTIEMAKVTDKLTFHPRYEKKAKEIIKHYGDIISDCSSWVLDENEADKIIGMTSDKGGILDFESVKTIEELVRFMHAEMAKIPIRSIYRDLYYKEEGLAFLELADFGLTNFICLNMDEKKAIENLEAYKILKKAVKDMPEELTEMKMGEKAIAFMGHDYAEITLPMGKHFAEIKCEMDDQNKCYAVNVRYVDTMYTYAQSRKAYVEKVLTDLGFTIDENMKRTIMATLRTEDRKTWAEGYGELIRLMFSAKDLDLGCDPNESAEMFQCGFTWIRRCDPGYETIMYSDDTEKVEKYREIIGSELYDISDKRAFTDLFMEQFDYRPSKIVLLVKDFELNELDKLFGFLVHLEEKAKKEGDKRKIGQIKRLWKKLEKALDEKESQI